jgi:hypothetical protein
MTFQQAVESVTSLRGWHRAGLEALEADHRPMVEAPTATGSIDIDKALNVPGLGMQNAHRYDYGIGLPPRVHVPGAPGPRPSRAERVAWVEVHPARTDQISEMLAKRQSLKDWLVTNAEPLLRMTDEFVWVPSDRLDIPPRDPRRRQLTGLIRLSARPCRLE